jgi:hypothetical protein
VAQTRRRRHTKHRGNAAGVVESRGRTGRKPTLAEKDPDSREAKLAKEKRLDRRDRPPTWRGAIVRAMAAAVLVLLIMLLVFKQSEAQAFPLFVLVLVLYVPIGYYTELWAYNRRMRSKAAQGAARKGSSR